MADARERLTNAAARCTLDNGFCWGAEPLGSDAPQRSWDSLQSLLEFLYSRVVSGRMVPQIVGTFGAGVIGLTTSVSIKSLPSSTLEVVPQ